MYSVKKSTYTKKEKSKSVFWGGKGCKTRSGTLLTDTDGHSTSKYCLANQSTFLHHPHTNFSKCWLFLVKTSQLWWEPGTGEKKRKMECTFKKVGSAIFFIINTKSENKLLYCGKYHPLVKKYNGMVIFAANSTTENHFNEFLFVLGWHKTEMQWYLS